MYHISNQSVCSAAMVKTSERRTTEITFSDLKFRLRTVFSQDGCQPEFNSPVVILFLNITCSSDFKSPVRQSIHARTALQINQFQYHLQYLFVLLRFKSLNFVFYFRFNGMGRGEGGRVRRKKLSNSTFWTNWAPASPLNQNRQIEPVRFSAKLSRQPGRRK